MTEQLDSTQATLLDNLIEITLPSGETIDLHNDFSCERIEYEAARLPLHFLQDVRVNKNESRHVIIEFCNATFNELELEGGLRPDKLGLGTPERIRYENEGELYDMLPDGRVVFLTH